MLISCNQIKKYIKNSDDIDFKTIWNTFTMKTAEVENVYVKGEDLKDVVTAKIVSIEKHPDSKKLSLVKVSDGKEEYNIVCGAPNVRVGLITALVKVGGMVSGIKITERKIAGYLSSGMLCAFDELGIGESHEGIIELPDNTPLGVDFCSLYPVKDVIVEIDNKSLTNRPDLWGHYGIAREIAAITNHELLSLPTLDVTNDKEDLDITISEKGLCKRYCGIKVENLQNNITPIDMQIFLNYCGMRSISLFVDLTNFLMLELGQPMHAFDARVVKNINVRLAKDGDVYTTLDGVERKLNKDTLMITNGKNYFGIAGIMGGLDSEILLDTTSVFLESANFLAGSIRKSAVALGLRTEASSRYEKSLDPNMCDLALKRLLYLLKKENPDMVISSNLTDIYPNPLKEIKIFLNKNELSRYTCVTMSDKEVKATLELLGFKVEINKDGYDIVVPTYRATKDISIAADIIEELIRMHGYDNISELPLEGKSTSTLHETYWDMEYKIKNYLATKWDMHEVHSYIWYDSDMLKELGIIKDGVKLLSVSKNNILRDDLSLSLLPIIKLNLKTYEEVEIFEIGTAIVNNQNERHLSILLANNENDVLRVYQKAKQILSSIFHVFKQKEVVLKPSEQESFTVKEKSQDIYVDNMLIGKLRLFDSKCNKYVGKKKVVVGIEIYFDLFQKLEKKNVLFKEISKYPTVTLDYTVLADNNSKYDDIEKVLNTFSSKLILSRSFVDVYEEKEVKKYTIRYEVGKFDKTLEKEELEKFKEKFISHIQKNGLEIAF